MQYLHINFEKQNFSFMVKEKSMMWPIVTFDGLKDQSLFYDFSEFLKIFDKLGVNEKFN